MKSKLFLFAFAIIYISVIHAQSLTPSDSSAIHTLIANYSKAREQRDTVLLKQILTADIDQLVSTGEWREGMTAAVQGMLQSSAASPGTRKLEIAKLRLLTKGAALVDCRYIIQNTDGTARNMWSSFVVVDKGGEWRIGAIRNMKPGK